MVMSQTSRGRNGVLPINATAIKKSTAARSDPKASIKPPAPRLRIIIRRLPPGLTETEFWTTVGEEWKLGNGKVEWAAYKVGKVSKDPSKPSRPARAYIKVKEPSHLDLLSAKVKQSVFQDAKNTTKDSCLIGPPSLEFAPFNKTPGGRIRHDGRQGTIDQDQEFIDFLQSLTEPVPKSIANGADGGIVKPEPITTTPLIQYIKEKKAAKAKESATAKSSKTKEAKATKAEKKAAVIVKKGSAPGMDKDKLAKATQETVNAINKSVAGMQKKTGGTTKDEGKPATPKETTPSTQKPPAKPERQRGNASAAAKILQRDLGLTPREPRSRRAQQAASMGTGEDKIVKAETPTSPNPSTAAPVKPPVTTPNVAPAPAAQPASQAQPPPTPPTGPKNARPTPNSAKPTVQQQQQVQQPPRPSRPIPQITTGAKSAFLKHANPSQGVTEDLLRTTFEAFGTVTRCEIDRKKGFGYIDFADAESLKKAIQASPVKIANGQVVVLENKAKPGSNAKQPSAPTSPALSNARPSPATNMTSAAGHNSASTRTPPTGPKAVTATTGTASSTAGSALQQAQPQPRNPHQTYNHQQRGGGGSQRGSYNNLNPRINNINNSNPNENTNTTTRPTETNPQPPIPAQRGGGQHRAGQRGNMPFHRGRGRGGGPQGINQAAMQQQQLQQQQGPPRQNANVGPTAATPTTAKAPEPNSTAPTPPATPTAAAATGPDAAS